MWYRSIEEKQRLEVILCDQLKSFTMSGLHSAFEVIRQEVGNYRIQNWLKGERV